MRSLQEPTRGFRFGNDDGFPNDPSRVGHARLLMILIMPTRSEAAREGEVREHAGGGVGRRDGGVEHPAVVAARAGGPTRPQPFHLYREGSMGRKLIHGKKSIWIAETVSSRNARVSPRFKTTGELADWLVSRGYSRKAAETFIEKGFACTLCLTPNGPVMNINQFDPDNSHGTTLGEIPRSGLP
jgi:hypothetical protein